MPLTKNGCYILTVLAYELQFNNIVLIKVHMQIYIKSIRKYIVIKVIELYLENLTVNCCLIHLPGIEVKKY